MAYKFDKDKNLKKNITEVASEEVQACLDSLENMGIHEAVHDIRKRLKKIRALARLVRDEMGEENYKNINVYYRDLGRELSDLRDLTAHMETIEILRDRYGDHLYVNFFNSIIKRIQSERDEMEKQMRQNDFFDKKLPEKLRYAQKELVKWPISKTEIKIILPSIKRVYERGQKAMKKSMEEPNKEIYHEWRKRVKYLWYQILLLQETWPQFFNTMEAEIHELSDFLGDDHDLMVLKDKLGKQEEYLDDTTQKELLEAVVKEYSQHLRKESHIKGGLIYAEEPEEFEKRMAGYLSVSWN